MQKEKALRSFRQPPLNLNCAQAIAHGFDRDDLVAEMSNCGSGRAPGGLCGALYCAMRLGENSAENIAADFEKKLGYRNCSQLKRAARVPCRECVATAAQILSENFLKNELTPR